MYEELLISGEQLATENPKIFKSMERFPDLEVMLSLISKLENSISNDNAESIVNLLKENVEGYRA
jgi:FlaA1/EpsC-like NDP-sugar epimerase